MSDAIFSEEEAQTYELLQFADLHLEADSSVGKPTSFINKKKEPEPEIVLPTAAELEAIQTQAREEGYQTAYAEGSKRMETLLATLGKSIQQAEQDMAQEILDLSLEIARQMVKQTLHSKPEVLIGIIREAIVNLPHFTPGAHLVLHPEDAEIVRTQIGEQLNHTGWKIFENAEISRGGAKIETAHTQIDATVENRWKRIVGTIGQDTAWMDE